MAVLLVVVAAAAVVVAVLMLVVVAAVVVVVVVVVAGMRVASAEQHSQISHHCSLVMMDSPSTFTQRKSSRLMVASMVYCWEALAGMVCSSSSSGRLGLPVLDSCSVLLSRGVRLLLLALSEQY